MRISDWSSDVCSSDRNSTRPDPVGGVLKDLLDDRVNGGTREGPRLATDRQQKRRGFTGYREGCQAFFAPITCQLDHQFVRCRDEPGFLAFTGHLQSPAFFPIFVTSTKEAPHGVLRHFRNEQSAQVEQGKQTAQPRSEEKTSELQSL